jgi:hypothetical protein
MAKETGWLMHLNKIRHTLLKSIVSTDPRAILPASLPQQDQVPALGYSLETAHSSASQTRPPLCNTAQSAAPLSPTTQYSVLTHNLAAAHPHMQQLLCLCCTRTCPPLPMLSACPIASFVWLCASSRVCRWGRVPWPSRLEGLHLAALPGTHHRHRHRHGNRHRGVMLRGMLRKQSHGSGTGTGFQC